MKNKALDDAKKYINADPEYKRDFTYYTLHPEEIPQEGEIEAWQPYTLADAFQERQPIQYIATGLFKLPSVNIVYGSPGTLKSFIMADLALSIASGGGFLPPAPWQPNATEIKTIAAPAMWIDFDNGSDITHERIEALARGRGLQENTPFYYFSMPDPWLDASKLESIGLLARTIAKYQAKFIVIDNLGTVSGGVDENSGQMIKIMSHFRRLAEETEAAIILIHHQRKSNGFTGRAGDNLRGHSSIEAAIDLALHVAREEGSDTINMKSTKTRGVDVFPFSAAFTYENNSQGNLYKAVFYGLAAHDTTSTKAIEKEILEILELESMNQKGLLEAMKENLPEVGKQRVLDMLKRLENNKKIKVTRGQHNAKTYTLI